MNPKLRQTLKASKFAKDICASVKQILLTSSYFNRPIHNIIE